MPYKLSDNGLCVIKADSGETVKCHDTHEEALAHLRALEANVDDAKSASKAKMNRKARMAEMRDRAQQMHDHAAAFMSHLDAMMPMEPDEDDAGKSAPDPETIPAEVAEPEPERKGMDFSYAKSLGLTIPEKELAVKYVGRDEIKGYTFLWGSDALTDVEREYFTKSSDFWDERLGKNPRPLTWDHAQDEDFKSSPVIGQIVDFGDDEVGRWYAAKLDRSHKYRKAIDALIEKGVLGTSSDSAPQYVVRQKTGKATWLKQWPWFASALTDVPCEPRMIGSIDVLKSLGITIPDAPPPATWEWDTARLALARIQP